MKTIVIRHLADKLPTEYIQVSDNTPTHKVIERFQSALANRGMSTGVSYQVQSGNIVKAMCSKNFPETVCSE